MCNLQKIDVKFDGSITAVRYARASGDTLTLAVPSHQVKTDGTYIGELSYGPNNPYRGPILIEKGSSVAQVELWLVPSGYYLDDRDENDNKRFAVHVIEDRRLHFLVYDHGRSVWFLSCGGILDCWWCRDESGYSGEILDDDCPEYYHFGTVPLNSCFEERPASPSGESGPYFGRH